MQAILSSIFNVESIWFFIFQSALWFGICLVLVGSLVFNKNKEDFGSVKQNLGFFLFFIFLSTGLLYIMFGNAGT